MWSLNSQRMEGSTELNAHFRVCMVCHSTKRTTERLAERIKNSLDLVVPLKVGSLGQCSLVIDREVLSLTAYLEGGDEGFEELVQYVLAQLRNRSQRQLAS